jgi:hypothetical protein
MKPDRARDAALALCLQDAERVIGRPLAEADRKLITYGFLSGWYDGKVEGLDSAVRTVVRL